MQHRRRALVHFFVPEELERASERVSSSWHLTGGDFLRGIAQAVSANSFWADVPDGVVVVRDDPTPALGIFGTLDDAAVARVVALYDHLGSSLGSLRYVSYERAAADTEILAKRLVERLGRDWLTDCSFAAIPRGGYIVLGMLATALRLSPSQLDGGGGGNPLVVVDDCALTGHRFGGYLRGRAESEIVFAHLYSHPDLRVAIEQETQVRACIAADDLHDWGPQVHGEHYQQWRESWQHRTRERYWMGVPDYLCFAWKEPDRPLWNVVTERMEDGWRTMPPELCLSNRAVTMATSKVPVQVQPPARGPLRPAAPVLYAMIDDALVVGDAKSGTAFEFNGTAAEMWHAVVRHGAAEPAAAGLAATYGHEQGVVYEDLSAFIKLLIDRGLLEEAS